MWCNMITSSYFMVIGYHRVSTPRMCCDLQVAEVQYGGQNSKDGRHFFASEVSSLTRRNTRWKNSAQIARLSKT